MGFGDRLSLLLQEREMKKSDLAKELHIAPNTLSGYITGNRQADHDTLVRIAQYFDVTTDYLLGVTDYPNRAEGLLTAREAGLVGKYRRLDPLEQDFMYDYMDFQHKGPRKPGGKPLRRAQREEYKTVYKDKNYPRNE